MEVEKLPKWAQEIIKDISRERETAIRALNEYVDSQTPSPFYIDETECLGEQQGPSTKRRYIQAHRITVVYEGVRLDILLRDDTIDLKWGAPNFSMDEIAFIPSSFQSARLVSRDKMR